MPETRASAAFPRRPAAIAVALAVAAAGAALLLWTYWPRAALVAAGAAGGAVLTAWLLLRRDRTARTGPPSTAGAAEEHAPAAPASSDAGPFAGLEAVGEPVLATNGAGIVVACNPAAAALLGIDRARAVGRPVEDVFTQAELLRLHAEAREGRAVRRQVPLGGPEGVRLVQVAAAPLAGEGGVAGRAIVMTLRDVTEPARALQVRTDFVANASHELRTPLAALKGAVETLTSGAADDPAMRERLIGMIAANVDRLDEMVRDLLDLSRLESPEARVEVGPVPGSSLAATLAPLFEGICRERSLTLRFDLAPDLEGLRTDRRLLELILKNLIENATRFAYEGTEVRVAGRATPGPDGGRRGARFEVIDRGIGIPLDQQARIFERFYQVDEARTGQARRGSGLGLAIVKHAVRTLGGSVRVSSIWKQGTTVIVELPDCLAPSAEAQSSGR